MSQEPPKISFPDFISAFPPIELPITLTDETIHLFNKTNPPFPAPMVEQYLIPLEQGEIDEYTEFVPCFSISDTYDFLAVVYWKGGLMNHQYIMATFTKKAELIDKRVIAGTFSDNELLVTSVATIDPDWEILIVSGKQPAQEKFKFDATKSTRQRLEILPEGKIINMQ
ncbi:MAG TPA: hypothetical protein VJ953_09855 [Saprospiraceae bacterium]|nr:hypothetical protein [Saprospiraceae bacterium]